MLKIFSGIYKGRRLKTVSGSEVRPTTAKLKLSFFDILQDQIRGTIFLDGFGGSGNMGIEALSRGASYVVFIDELPESVKLLRENLEHIGVPRDHYRIIQGDFNRSVIALSKERYLFDIIFLDPPYEMLNYANPLKVVYKRGILAPDGMLVLERPAHTRFEGKYFERYRVQTLGRKCLDFYKLSSVNPAVLMDGEPATGEADDAL
jgi:16S rRNA (guanine(966)-N(2))-methyltransferase RsmD